MKKKVQLKPLSEQVIVITGASSGIGLRTARDAAERGAKLILVARNGEALEQLTEAPSKGSEAIHVIADVSDEDVMREVARLAIQRFGRIDTWVNNAGISIFGSLMETSTEDAKRLFDTNFWGVVHGSKVAVEHLAEQGGALINVGSEVSQVAIPLQGIYSASKHAVKGFTDALRVELEEQGKPISVTLIKPAAIDTPYVEHAKNYMDVEPKLPAPIYAPDVVSNAILFAAEHPRRDIFVGGAAKLSASAAYFAPKLVDKFLAKVLTKQQRTDKPARNRESALYQPGRDLRERNGAEGHVMESSAYTAAAMRPGTTSAVVAALALGAMWLFRRGARA